MGDGPTFIFDEDDDAIDGNGFTDVTITDNTFRDGTNTQYQIELVDMTGAITIIGNTFIQDGDTDATDMDTAASGTCTMVFNDNTFQLANPTADSDDCFQVEVDGTTVATIQMDNNIFTGSATGTSSHENALYIETDDTSQTTVTATGNMATFVEQFLELDTDDDSTLTGTFTGNTSDQSTDIDLDLDSNGNSAVTLTFDNNSFSNSDSETVDADSNNNSNFTLIVANSMLTNAGHDAIEVDANNSSTFRVALRNSTFTTTGSDAVTLSASGSANLCAEITGNTFGDDLAFSETTTGDFDVEQFGDVTGDILATLNTFTSGGIMVDNGTVNSVADGACAIP